MVEHHVEAEPGRSEFALEVSYSASVRLEEAMLEDTSRLDEHFGGLGGWLASTLVRLADLDLAFLPPELEEDGRR